jgi:hypothetical protein
MNGDTIYLIGDDGPVEMRATLFDSEADLQDLVARYPNLLAGAQMTPGDPRRWLLVRREMGVPVKTGGSDNFSVDHLFVDHEADPTVVEVKRSTDTRIRREVVGQMLDYAANGVRYWPAEHLRRLYEEQCVLDARDPLEYLQEVVGPDVEPDDFWFRVGENLEIGRVRMVFVADVVPPELQRIVEFLNEGMTRAQVYAVEIPQFRATDGRRSVVPRLIGATGWATSRPGRDRSQPSLEEALADAPGHVRQVGDLLSTWAAAHGLEGRDTRTAVLFSAASHALVWFSPKDGTVWLYLNYLRSAGRDEQADQLLNELQAIVPTKRLTPVQPGLPTEVLADRWEEAVPVLDRYLSTTTEAIVTS